MTHRGSLGLMPVQRVHAAIARNHADSQMPAISLLHCIGREEDWNEAAA